MIFPTETPDVATLGAIIGAFTAAGTAAARIIEKLIDKLTAKKSGGVDGTPKETLMILRKIAPLVEDLYQCHNKDYPGQPGVRVWYSTPILEAIRELKEEIYRLRSECHEHQKEDR